jgi:hypothetical protein
MEEIRKTIKIASPVTGQQILEAIENIAKRKLATLIKRKTILIDEKQGYTVGLEFLPADYVMWLVIGHGPVADRTLFLEESYSKLFLRTEKNLEYRPSDEVYQQRFGIAQESIQGLMTKFVGELEKLLLPKP